MPASIGLKRESLNLPPPPSRILLFRGCESTHPEFMALLMADLSKIDRRPPFISFVFVRLPAFFISGLFSELLLPWLPGVERNFQFRRRGKKKGTLRERRREEGLSSAFPPLSPLSPAPPLFQIYMAKDSSRRRKRRREANIRGRREQDLVHFPPAATISTERKRIPLLLGEDMGLLSSALQNPAIRYD